MITTKKLLTKIDPIFNEINNQEFIDICNKIGVEVESIKKLSLPENLQIVKILEINKHPNADKLNIVKVDLDQETLDIVCGANNVTINKYAILAPVGTKIKDFVIEKRSIRGIESQGMLCGYEEIVDFDHTLISDEDKKGIILFDEAKVGDKDVASYLNTDDTIYDLSIASNRNDLNAALLFASEFKYAYNETFDLATEINFNPHVGWTLIKEVNEHFCNSSAFIQINNLKPYKTSWKEKEILIACGYKVQNNWNDLINLFTIYFGNPINIYDGSKINLKNIEIKQIIEPTKIISNNKEYEATTEMFGIYNGDTLINLQGYLINDEFKYTDSSINVVFEINNYNHEIITKFNDQLKTSNKVQSIFMKPLSSWITQNTYNELSTYLINQSHHLDVIRNFQPIIPITIGYNEADLYRFLGIKEGLHFNKVFDANRYYVHPSRLDIKDEYDVFEEALKIININDLKAQPINFDYHKTNYSNYNNLIKLKSYLIDWGFYETKTYNLSSETDYQKFNLFNFNNEVKVINPISKIREYLRFNLIDEQLKVIKYNLSRKRVLHNIFEIQNINDGFDKYYPILSMIISTDLMQNKLADNFIPSSFMNIKSLIRNSFKKINLNLFFNDAKNQNDQYEEIKTIEYQNKVVGYITKLSKKAKQAYDLNEIENIYTVSIDLSDLLENKTFKTIKPITSFPLVHRDINITINDEIKLNKLIKDIKDTNNVYDCKIKELFNKDNQSIYTLNVTIYDNLKTLNSEEIDKIINEINLLISKINN